MGDLDPETAGAKLEATCELLDIGIVGLNAYVHIE